MTPFVFGGMWVPGAGQTQEGWGGREDPLRQRDPSQLPCNMGGQTSPEDCWVPPSTDCRLTCCSSAEAGPWEVKPDFTVSMAAPQ